MATLTVSLPDSIKAWIEERVGDGEFDTADDFLSDLLTRERERSDEERIAELRRIVDESLASGISTRSLDEILAEAIEITKANGTYRE